MLAASTLLFLALAVSIDNFSTGIAYGLRKIIIPFRSILTIGLCAASGLAVGIVLGTFSKKLIDADLMSRIGALILIAIGIFTLINYFKKNEQKQSVDQRLFYWEFKSFGIVVEIMRKPVMADLDQSGSITGVEAVLLGLALSLDSFGVGIGAAMMNVSYFSLVIMVFFMSSFFLFLGLSIGKTLARQLFFHNLAILPGVVLIIIGLVKLI